MKDSRSKSEDVKLSAMRFDTKISTIEKKYNIDLGMRRDMKLGHYLKRKGYPSLSKMLAS
jgi:hypothetical protein